MNMNSIVPPLISVITVVLNDVKNIEKTITSVITQTYSNIEYIIVDGGSTDGTIEIIKKYQKHISVLVSEPDKGIYDAMNKGTSLATGKWISYMNSDDTFNANNVIYDIFVKNGNAILNYDVIYSDVIADYKTKKKILKSKKINSFWRGQCFSHQAHFVKTSIEKNRPFNLKYSITADYDFLYAVFKDLAKFYYYEYPIAIIDVTAGISKTSNLKHLYKDFFEINKKYSSTTQYLLVRVFFTLHLCYANTRRYLFKKKQKKIDLFER